LTNKKYCCCFTGHRPEKLNVPERLVVERLDAAIREAMEQGYTTFLSGASKGVDLWAGELVLQHRVSRPEIQLVCAVPFQGFGLHWRDGWTDRFNRVLQEADSVEYVCKTSSRSVYQRRNQWLVDHSSHLIAAYTGASGGTRNTIDYARKHGGCEIVFLDISP